MSSEYGRDILAWAEEQAALLRARDFGAIDVEHLAEEIEDVGKSEQRELAGRMAVLISHLLKWQSQPGRRGRSWERTVREQRRAIAAHLAETPSLRRSLANTAWMEGVWADAVTKAIDETGLDDFPEDCPWPIAQILASEFYPN
jgi:hypothetical protein